MKRPTPYGYLVYLSAAVILGCMLVATCQGDPIDATRVALSPRLNIMARGSADNQAVADEALRRLGRYQIRTPVIVTIVVDRAQDKGLVWLRSDPTRRFHKVWVYGGRNRIWAILRHEMQHCADADRYGLPGSDPKRLAWFERRAQQAEEADE